jgi:hypothetical protein
MDLRTLGHVFEQYDAVDLVTSLAALQLLPQNACALGRLEAAATAAAALQSNCGRPAMSVGRLRTTLNTPPVSTTLSRSDPRFDELLVEPFAFHGGSHLVSPGIGRETVYIMERLTRGIFFQQPVFPNQVFVDEALGLCMAGLRVSDLVLTRAGLTRYTLPQGDVDDPIVAGAPGQLDQLKQAVCFSHAELTGLLKPITILDLAPLVQDLGFATVSADMEHGGALHLRPILRSNGKYIVALPLGLLDAVRHLLLCAAARHGCAQEVAGRFRAEVATGVGLSLAYMRISNEGRDLPSIASLPVIDRVFRLDDDKLLYTQVITDDLKDYDDRFVFGEWENRGLSARLDARRLHIEQELVNASAPNTRVMYLAVTQLMGRSWIFEFDATDRQSPVGPQLAMSGADLEVLAEIENSEPVALYKYAENRGVAAPPGHPFLAADQLGAYALYRANGYSLRMDWTGEDSMKPLGYFGAGLQLRAEAKLRTDRHGAHYAGNAGVLVQRIAAEGTEPIYLALPPPDPSRPMLVEGLPAPVWVLGSTPSDSEQAERNHQFIWMVAFWLWQMTDDLGPAVSAASPRRRPVHIRLDLSEADRWTSGDPTGSRDFGSTSIKADGTVSVRFGAGNYDWLRQEGNRGERVVMQLVIDGLNELVEEVSGTRHFGRDEVTAILDRQFENPRKKHLLLLGSNNVEATPGELPEYRPVQHPDRSEVKYELSEYLRSELGLTQGIVIDSRRTEVLGAARDWCLKEIERRVAELSPVGVLERLIALNESVVRERFMTTLKLPTRLACYESEAETRERLTREIPELSLTGIVSRFLVEYVTAVPPSGAAPVSMTVTDRLAAIAAEMQGIAQALDALTNDLSNAGLFLNEHDELTLETTDPYVTAQNAFLDIRVTDSLAAAESKFAKHWATRNPPPALLETPVAELDAAMTHETGGLSLLDIRSLVEQIVHIGVSQSTEPKQMMRDDLERKLVNDIGWPANKVKAGIEFMLLKPRGTFYANGTGTSWARSDVQPWRFNRRLSYLRRPLIARETQRGTEVLWGVRHLWEAWPMQLTYLNMSRFRASSPQLIQLLGRTGDRRGKEFEHKVADLYKQHPRFEVLAGRDKFGGLTVSRPGPEREALGDIDVLVAEPAHKTLTAVEAKDIAMALTPSELAEELATHFVTQQGAKRAAAMDRHLERIAWLKAHLPEVLSEFAFDPGNPSSWTVKGLFVTDDAVPSPHIVRPALPVVSYRELEAQLNDSKAAERPRATKKRRARRN